MNVVYSTPDGTYVDLWTIGPKHLFTAYLAYTYDDGDVCYEEVDVRARDAAEAERIARSRTVLDAYENLTFSHIGRPSCGTVTVTGY